MVAELEPFLAEACARRAVKGTELLWGAVSSQAESQCGAGAVHGQEGSLQH